MLTGNNGKPIRGELKLKGAIGTLGNNKEPIIAETQGNNQKGPIGDPWR